MNTNLNQCDLYWICSNTAYRNLKTRERKNKINMNLKRKNSHGINLNTAYRVLKIQEGTNLRNIQGFRNEGTEKNRLNGNVKV